VTTFNVLFQVIDQIDPPRRRRRTINSSARWGTTASCARRATPTTSVTAPRWKASSRRADLALWVGSCPPNRWRLKSGPRWLALGQNQQPDL